MSSASSNNNNNNNTSKANGIKYEARLCHIVKRDDFDGYGFNLHAEKGRPGQYIGKVDDGSPAESAGLRQGDRILEVNGTSIANETHKKVVELIKMVPNETKLLVIDPKADASDLKAAGVKAAAGKNGVDVNDNSKHVAENGSEKKSAHSPVSEKMTNGKDSLNENGKSKHDVNGSSNGSHEDTNNKKNSSANSNGDTTSANNNNKSMANGDSKKPVDQIIEGTKGMTVAGAKQAEANGKAMNGSSNGNGTATATKTEGPKLNLNMTAAELRAQLAARKKYDPKNDVCDLRKKYEIIQKM
ncbi:Na(+)/H(+) exchange regulatory cofactor NHE-RF2-like [Uranotaenia lowii]|uniref:Na(+)/H(+) exchange regulatory cofactor NHE-RF2-like n=1 Tax=Uranotaenia lowii TaxID=190385 RepID=UPI00247AED76|nr:Na(+)/H(+) exchange regulatory cofactor NHE-RF2-like [Uranotaenia lowii]